MSSSEPQKIEIPLMSENDLDASTEKAAMMSPLPTPVSQQPPKPKMQAAGIIPIWMVFSMSTILFNKHILDSMGFKYPIFLTTFHLLFASIGTRILRRTTHLLDGVEDVEMTRDKFLVSILPVAGFMSCSLIASNTAYLHLGVAFIQMMKAFVPVAILLISFAARIQEPNRRLMAIVCIISTGVAIASYGEADFKLLGFLIQASAVLFEATRLVLVQILLHGRAGFKMDPLVSLYYFAPVVVLINAALIPFTEGLEPFRNLHLVGPYVLLANAAVAFCLNVAAVFLIGVGSGLILTLAGILKDILMISGGVLFFGEKTTPIQVFGYMIALGGLFAFKFTSSK